MFDQLLEGFQDALVMSRMAKVTLTDQQTMERTGDIIWFPQPYILTSYSGNDATSNFKAVTQLSVPGIIDQQQHVPWTMSARELRDIQQEGRIKDSAYQRLSSDINVDISDLAAVYGSVVSKRTVAATGFDDLGLCDAILTEQGIPPYDRVYGAGPRDYLAMAGNLAARALYPNSKPVTAYEKGYVGEVSRFKTSALDYAYRLTAALGVGVTMNGANQRYVPVATTTTAGRGSLNVDNRFQTIAVTVTSGTVKVGDCLTIAGVNAVHHITKQDTGQLKTFRIVEIVTGAGGTGTVKITPPIIAADSSPTPAEEQYKNVTATPANGAAITFLNTVTAPVNPFWQGDAVQVLPGRLEPRRDSGLAVMTGETDQGFQLVMTRQGEINDLSTKYRVDAIWGAFAANPEMMGIQLFNQS